MARVVKNGHRARRSGWSTRSELSWFKFKLRKGEMSCLIQSTEGWNKSCNLLQTEEAISKQLKPTFLFRILECQILQPLFITRASTFKQMMEHSIPSLLWYSKSNPTHQSRLSLMLCRQNQVKAICVTRRVPSEMKQAPRYKILSLSKEAFSPLSATSCAQNKNLRPRL